MAEDRENVADGWVQQLKEKGSGSSCLFSQRFVFFKHVVK